MLIFVRPSVRSFGSKLSRAFNLHHSGSGIFQVSLRSFLGLSLSLSFSKISDLTYSDRRSLKYSVLFIFTPGAGGDPAPGGRYKRPWAGPGSQSESVSRHLSTGLVIMLASSGLIK